MALTGSEYEQLQNALLSAFTTHSALARMVRFRLDLGLDTIAGGSNLGDVIFNLIQWAEANGRVEELIAGARQQNPSNAALRAFEEGRGATAPAIATAGLSLTPEAGPNMQTASPTAGHAVRAGDGKRYDAFLSYRHAEPDRQFAVRLLRDLQAAGFTVAIDERDFTPQATFLEEMERCIKESRFTLAVVSSRYLQSGNTVEEAIVTKVLDMHERRRRLIPLVIEPVEVPVWLYDIVGIDWTAPDPLVPPLERLKRALANPR